MGDRSLVALGLSCDYVQIYTSFFLFLLWSGFPKHSLLTELPCSFESQVWLIACQPAEELEVTQILEGALEKAVEIVFWWIW